ncbi:NPC intracellular cholesterol transporter 1-like [Symsagittifera roscoffensis]|uniref:NPC intracellular cholesterol transporter 1-like n=1 Tax=Symsagittifera roscoffensis TaxID=84072 RepID=UPI00307B1122
MADDEKKNGETELEKKNGETELVKDLDMSSIDEEDDSFNACNFVFLEQISDRITSFVQGVFHRIGGFCGRYPWASLLIGFAIFALPLVGLRRYHEETNASKLWVPSNSRAVGDARMSEQWFPAMLRVVRVIITADGGDVLTPEALTRAVELDESIKNITVQSEGENGTTVDLSFAQVCYHAGPQCMQMSILQLWQYDKATIQKLTKQQILTAIHQSKSSGSSRMGMSVDVVQYLGGVEVSSSASGGQTETEIESAEAMSMTYFIQTYENRLNPEPYVLEWEQRFLDTCSEGIEGYSVYYLAVRSFSDIGGGTIKGDLRFLGVGYILVILYLTINLGNLNFLESKCLVALGGIVCIVMSMAFSVGFSSLLGFAAGPLNRLLPFLLLGIGVDNMFVFVAAYDNLSSEEKGFEVSEKIALMVKHAGVSILITSLTDFSAFAIGASTIIPSLRSFCLFSAFGIVGVFLVTLFFFTGILTYDQKREKANRNACLFCCKLPSDYSRNECSKRPLFYRFFDHIATTVLALLPVKIVVVVVALLLFAIGLAGTVQIEQDYQEDWFIPEGNYFYDYIQISKQYFQSDGDEAFVFFGAVDYYANDEKLLWLPEELGAMPQIASSRIDFWLTAYYGWLNQTTDASVIDSTDSKRRPKDADEFIRLLNLFLQRPSGMKYERDINMNEEQTVITSSRMLVWFYKTSKSSEGIEAMDNSRAIVDSVGLGNENAFIYSRILLTWEGFTVIRAELFRNVGLAFAVVFLVCMILIANIITVLLVLCCVVFTMVEVVGVLYFWGLTINVVTTINIVLSIGLVVDYAAHIGHSFMLASGSKQQRVRRCLRAMGAAVFNGGITTFLAFLPLIMSKSFVFSTFFKVFLLVAFCGLFHGLVFLPVALSWFGPAPYLSVQRQKEKQQYTAATDV